MEKGVRLTDFQQLVIPFLQAWYVSVEGTLAALVHSSVKGDSEFQGSNKFDLLFCCIVVAT